MPTLRLCSGAESFSIIISYRLTYPACCGLANPDTAAAVFAVAEQVDSLWNYTDEMCGVLTDVVLREWFGLRRRRSKVPWEGPVYLPDEYRLLCCLDRHCARQAKADIHRHYLSLNREPGSTSIVAGYGLAVPNDQQREREGLVYLARQAEHFRSLDDYLFIVQET